MSGKKVYVLPLLTALLGVGGFFLRRWQLVSAFEKDTGLAVPGAPAFWASTGLCLLTALLFLVLTGRNHRLFSAYEEAFVGRGRFAPLLLGFASGALFLAAGGIEFYLWQQHSVGLLGAVAGGLCLLTGLCNLLVAAGDYRARPAPRFCLLPGGFALCLWVMNSYQGWSKNPTVSSYAFLLFALLFGMLALYFLAGFAFGSTPVFLAVFCALFSVYCCFVSLADALPLAELCLMGALITHLLSRVMLLLRGDTQVGPRRAGGKRLGVQASPAPTEAALPTEDAPQDAPAAPAPPTEDAPQDAPPTEQDAPAAAEEVPAPAQEARAAEDSNQEEETV